MVRWVWQNRLVLSVNRFFRLFVRWVLIWLSYLVRTLRRHALVTARFFALLIKPRNPNNLFVAGLEGAYTAPEVGVTGSAADPNDPQHRRSLLWAGGSAEAAPAEAPLNTDAVSLWRGGRRVTAAESNPAAVGVNRRFSYFDVLAAQLKKISGPQIKDLEALVQRLARKWLDMDEIFEQIPRRNKFDVGETLRYNIPRYAGKILNFKWATKDLPVPQLSKPARILVIGDVSHSMVHYVSVILYFMHMLNFRFIVDSYIFSENATHSAPFLNGLGTFEEKVHRLVVGAKSWNAGTRFGSALEEIATQAHVDAYTHVLIATDGKVSLQGQEAIKIERYMKELRAKAKQVVFLTPSAEFSEGASGKAKPDRLGSFEYGFVEIPIFEMGPPLWYGVLSRYADRLYLVRSVQDLVDMTEDLIVASKG